MDDEKLSYFEKRLTREVEEIEERIKELKEEKSNLLRQIAKAHAERTGIQSVTRKNSLHRVLAENSVVELLKNNGRAPTAKLFHNAQLTNFDLKETTFRTYLHRMKKKNIIKTSRAVGYWELVVPPTP
jgi:predicted nuclease with TOPRIM domain